MIALIGGHHATRALVLIFEVLGMQQRLCLLDGGMESKPSFILRERNMFDASIGKPLSDRLNRVIAWLESSDHVIRCLVIAPVQGCRMREVHQLVMGTS